MKHSAKKAVAALLMIALLLPTLMACSLQQLTFSLKSAEERAWQLLTLDLNDQKGVSSYRITTETTMSGKTTADGTWSRNDTESYTVSDLHDPEALHHYNSLESSITYGEAEPVTTVTEAGYADGWMFSRQCAADGEAVSLSSPLSAEEYLAHLKALDDQLLPQILQSTAGTVSCEKNDAGEWVARFTDFNGTGLERLALYFGSSSTMFGDKMENAELTLRADSDLLPIEMRFDIVFAASEKNISRFSCVSRYEDYNTASADALDLTEFQKVKDLRLAAEAAAFFRRIECSSNLSYSKTERYYLKPDTESGRKSLLDRYDYVVEQKEDETGYTFNATVTEGDSVMKYDYANGRLFVEENGAQNPAKQITDASARSRVYGWFDTAFFDHFNLTTSETVDQWHRFKFKSVDVESFESRLNAVGSGLDAIRRTSSMLDVEIKDGKMVSYTYMATIWIYRYGSAYVFYYEVTVDHIQYS